MSNHTMTAQEIYDTISSLAQSQGFYSRLKLQLDEADESTRAEILNHLESMKLKDSVDLVLLLEC